jgi:tetratricopeptide (TPR) repeat protein
MGKVPQRFAHPQATAPSNPTPSLDEAFALHKAGRLDDAAEFYRQILAVEPDNFDCLHLLGLIFLHRGRLAAAVDQFDLALRRDPNSVMALNNRGLALRRLRRFEEALASYNRALVLRPDYAEALCNRGVTLHEMGRFADAVASYDRALALLPDNADAHFNRGNALHESKRFDEALASYDRALKLRPEFAAAQANRANPLHALKRFEEALAAYDRMVTLEPNQAAVHYNRGNALHELKRFDEALTSFDRALVLQPSFADAHFNRGNALHELKRFDDALSSYDRALALRPDHADSFVNRAATLSELRRIDEALASYQSALVVRPGYAEVHYCEALCRLLVGDYERGWEKNEWRWQTEALRHSGRSFPQPLWLGENDIAGKTILLHAEQGFGDTLQFCRYVPMVVARGAHVILEVQRPLHALMESLPAVAQIVSRGDALPAFDMHCPLLSLPLAFGTRLETIPSARSYLAASTGKANSWRDALGGHDKPRIGLVWSGNPRKELSNANRIDSQRSMDFELFVPLFDDAACEFYSLQKGDDAVKQLYDSAFSERVIDRTNELHDFSDTAALIENLDLVISVDTAVAHLAGALGKPFWLLNRYNTCWRWLLDRDDCPWYPTARQFRQDESRDWGSVIGRVAPALRDLVAGFAETDQRAGPR